MKIFASEHFESSGPSPNAKRSVCAGNPASAWRLTNNFIVHYNRNYSITEDHLRMQNQSFALAVDELESYITVMYTREFTQVACHCMSCGLKNGVCHCAKMQWLKIAFVKLSAFFVLMENRVVRKGCRPTNLPLLRKPEID